MIAGAILKFKLLTWPNTVSFKDVVDTVEPLCHKARPYKVTDYICLIGTSLT